MQRAALVLVSVLVLTSLATPASAREVPAGVSARAVRRAERVHAREVGRARRNLQRAQSALRARRAEVELAETDVRLAADSARTTREALESERASASRALERAHTAVMDPNAAPDDMDYARLRWGHAHQELSGVQRRIESSEEIRTGLRRSWRLNLAMRSMLGPHLASGALLGLAWALDGPVETTRLLSLPLLITSGLLAGTTFGAWLTGTITTPHLAPVDGPPARAAAAHRVALARSEEALRKFELMEARLSISNDEVGF